MLFYKKFYPFTYGYLKSSGRNHTGQTTSWSRQGLVFRQVVSSFFMVGLFKIYRPSLLPFHSGVSVMGVNRQGLLAQLAGVQRSMGYVLYSLKPSLPNNGNCMPLKWIPVGVKVCHLSYYARSGGSFIQILRHRQNFTQLRLPSKKELWVASSLIAVVGVNGNSRNKHQPLTKAGDLKFIGRRPSVRGVAMNPVDHPHGGGQGKTSGGRPGCSPWGQLAKGYKTRRLRVTLAQPQPQN